MLTKCSTKTNATVDCRIQRSTHNTMLKVNLNSIYLQLRLYSRASRKVSQRAQERVVKVAIIGLPNSGKSTLINSILNQRVSKKNIHKIG